MTHRPIDISAQAPLEPPAIQGTPRLEWVDLDQLMVDEAADWVGKRGGR